MATADVTSAPGSKPRSGRSVLLIGDGALPRSVELALARAGASVRWLRRPNDREIAAVLTEEFDVTMVVSRDDIEVLRIALVVEHARPGQQLIVTVFNRTVANQLRTTVPSCQVTSMADAVAATLAGPCIAEGLESVARLRGGSVGIREAGDGVEVVPLDIERRGRLVRALHEIRGAFRPYDLNARFLVAGLGGFLGILVLDAVVSGVALHQRPVEAFYDATKALVTVASNPAVDRAGSGSKLFAAVLILASLGLVAILTAGIINRLLDRRLTGIVGRRAIPRSDHVVVVGLGQVGLRLCLLLRSLGIGVVAVERDPSAPAVALARDYKIPVVIGPGGESTLLAKLSLGRARALAAITSDDGENIAITVAALAVREDLRVVLRAGDGDVTTEIRSLFNIGVVRDVHRIAGDLLAAAALGIETAGAAARDGETWLVMSDGSTRHFNQLTAGDGPPSEAEGANPSRS
ncbi:MAG: NAD-binding protein [Actinomycetota bacterium]|nr:NAD-binding protein [Actinomycetota bacterium]